MGMLDPAKVKAKREAMKLTQEEAAQRGGLASKQKWSDIESGRIPNPRLDTVVGVASALKCSIEDLLRDRKGK